MADKDPATPLEIAPTTPTIEVAELETIQVSPIEALERPPIFHMPSWQAQMWGGVAIALGVAGLLLIGLVATSIYRTTTMIDTKGAEDLAFIFSGLGLINTTLLRLLAMLIGAGIIFGGLAVSFFSSSDSNRISLQAIPAAGETFKAMVASHTPGIIGIFIGGVIIVAALFARSTHNYNSPERWIINPTGVETTMAVTKMPTSDELRKIQNSTPAESSDGSSKNEAN